jgi:hypothetical protein
MPDAEKIRFLTVNYSRLQGLKAVPWGLLLFLVVVWTNAQSGRARDITLPVVLLAAGILFYALIDGYYRRTYGRVEPVGHVFWVDVIISTGFSAAAVGAFIADMELRIPVSLFALLFASGLFLDYYRMIRLAGVITAVIYPAGLICIGEIALVAFLPLLGEDVLTVFGFRTPMLLVYALVGIIIVVYGAAGHLYLVRSMRPAPEAE